MNEHTSSQSLNQSNLSPQKCSQWMIHPELWNEDSEAEEKGQPQIEGIALREPNLREPDVVPMLLGFDGCPAQTIKPISVSLLHKVLGIVVRNDASPANDPATEEKHAYLEERLDWQ